MTGYYFNQSALPVPARPSARPAPPLCPAHRYIGVTERDYEWLTDQIVQVANR